MKHSNWILAAFACLALTACGPSDGKQGGTSEGSVPGTTFDLMGMGDPNAPVVLMEYASTTCPHCAEFAEDVFPAIKPRIDAGEVRYEFREFLTAPGTIAMAAFQIIRCAGEDEYFEGLDDVFKNQRGIITAAQSGAARSALQAFAKRHGLSEAEFNVCIKDDALVQRIYDIQQSGIDLGVSGTPSLFLNGKKLSAREAYTAEGLNALIDEALGIEPTEEIVVETETPVAEETPVVEVTPDEPTEE